MRYLFGKFHDYYSDADLHYNTFGLEVMLDEKFDELMQSVEQLESFKDDVKIEIGDDMVLCYPTTAEFLKHVTLTEITKEQYEFLKSLRVADTCADVIGMIRAAVKKMREASA